MKYLYRMDSAGNYWYDVESVARYIPIVEAKPTMLRSLYGGLLWYDKHNRPWALIGDGQDFSSKAEAIIALTEKLNEREGQWRNVGCIGLDIRGGFLRLYFFVGYWLSNSCFIL